ncbi:hypothetical protein ACFOW6_17750 [Fodinicurvata halophila]|uniref:Uncharacterized protein n=1 Tax=Fodinicurvata halophila TaxID=1419723 RepID=A0ABV8UQ27_9PROT
MSDVEYIWRRKLTKRERRMLEEDEDIQRLQRPYHIGPGGERWGRVVLDDAGIKMEISRPMPWPPGEWLSEEERRENGWRFPWSPI